MMKTFSIAITLALVLAGCSITQTVRPVAAAGDIREICIKRNPDVMMSEFVTTIQSQLEGKKIKARIYEGAAPGDCRHRMEYTANWRWDLAMYLVFAQLRVYEGEVMIGEANYDARSAGARLDKFGPTSEKLKALLDQLIRS